MNKVKCFFCQRRLRTDKGRPAHIRFAHPAEASDKELMRTKLLEEIRTMHAEQVEEERKEYPFGDGEWTDLEEDGDVGVVYDVECFSNPASPADPCPDPVKEYDDLAEVRKIGSEHARKTGHDVMVTRRTYATSSFILDSEGSEDRKAAAPAAPEQGASLVDTVEDDEPTLEPADPKPPAAITGRSPANPAVRKEPTRVMPP